MDIGLSQSKIRDLSNIREPELECLSFSKLREAVELPRLKKQLEYVVSNSPFYRHKFAEVLKRSKSLYDNFSSLPFTCKDEVVNDQIASPPFGSNLCVDRKHLLRIHKTSGTTNRPVIIAMTKADVDATVASGARCFWASGLRPEHIVVHCLSYCLWMGGYTDHQSLEATGATVVPYGVGNSKALLETIANLKVDAIHCTPSYLAILEELLKKEFNIAPAELGLKLGLFGGEPGVQTPAFREHIESVWGFRAMDANYGAADVLSMFGAECHIRNGLHFMGQGNILIELIEPTTGENLPVEKGVRGEMVITNINRQAQPVVRYRSGDVVHILDHNMCECGRKSFRFDVVGRSDDMIVVKGVNVFPGLIHNILTHFLDRLTGHFQIILDSPPPLEKLKLRIEYRGDVNQQAKKELIEVLRNDFAAKINVRPLIDLVAEGTLPRTHGKTRPIIKKM
jgi:phenylacetate-CoA ligase